MATPKKNPKDLEKVGRKTFDGKDEKIILLKLEEAFSIGCTDEEACTYADISTSSFYNYQKDRPEFQERKARLKDKPILLARKVVVDAIKDKDTDMAFKYLERKRKAEFGTRLDLTTDGEPLNKITVEFLNGKQDESQDSTTE